MVTRRSPVNLIRPDDPPQLALSTDPLTRALQDAIGDLIRAMEPLPGVRIRTTSQLAASGNDIVHFWPLLRSAWSHAVRVHTREVELLSYTLMPQSWQDQYLAEIHAAQDGPREEYWAAMQRMSRASLIFQRPKSNAEHQASVQASGQLLAAFKATFFFIRGFQDAMLRAMLEVEGLTSGYMASMGKAFDDKGIGKPNHPIGGLLATQLPDYGPWFVAMREKRNRIKEGASESLSGPQWDPGLNFNTITADGGVQIDASGQRAVRYSELEASVVMSTRLVLVAEARAKERRANLTASSIE